MQDNDQPALPSAHSAFTRPRRRVRPDIQPNPSLCRRLVFDDPDSNVNNSVNARDVTSEYDVVAQEDQEAFYQRWRSHQQVELNRHPTATSPDFSTSDWIPIPLSVKEAPSFLRRFQTSELNLETRPESPVPFLKRSSDVAAPNHDSSSSSSKSFSSSSSSTRNIHPASSPSHEPDSPICFLPRSLSDIPIRSCFKDREEDNEGTTSSKTNPRGCLTPPGSPRSKDDNLPSSSSAKSRNFKLTEFYSLKRSRPYGSRPNKNEAMSETGKKRRKTWSV